MRRGGRASGTSGSADPSLDPNTLTNAAHYWDPAVGYVLTGSDKYTDLADQITTGPSDLSQATDADRPLSVTEPLLNGRRVMQTVTTSEWLENGSTLGDWPGAFVHYIGVLLPGTTLSGSGQMTYFTYRFGFTIAADAIGAFVHTNVGGYQTLGTVGSIGTTTPLLAEIIIDGTNASLLINGAHGSSSPTADTSGIVAVSDAIIGAGYNGIVAGMAGMKFGPQALFLNASSGDPLSSGDRSLLLAQWNYDLGTSFT